MHWKSLYRSLYLSHSLYISLSSSIQIKEKSKIYLLRCTDLFVEIDVLNFPDKDRH